MICQWIYTAVLFDVQLHMNTKNLTALGSLFKFLIPYLPLLFFPLLSWLRVHSQAGADWPQLWCSRTLWKRWDGWRFGCPLSDTPASGHPAGLEWAATEATHSRQNKHERLKKPIKKWWASTVILCILGHRCVVKRTDMKKVMAGCGGDLCKTNLYVVLSFISQNASSEVVVVNMCLYTRVLLPCM